MTAAGFATLYAGGGLVAGWLSIRRFSGRPVAWATVALNMAAWPIWLPFLILPDRPPAGLDLPVDQEVRRVSEVLERCRNLVAGTNCDSLFDQSTHAALSTRLLSVVARRRALRAALDDLAARSGREPQLTVTTTRLEQLVVSDDAEIAELSSQGERLHAELLIARFGSTSGAQEVVDELSARIAGLEAVSRPDECRE